ncbi:hypothetical protein AB0M22_44875 [Nocardia sp. NPDC051756]|uniref:hypothetical protein n=1 Tax=Nocardia sp. NPDC051756 TaxID=3154751 RepID=UPI00341EC82F
MNNPEVCTGFGTYSVRAAWPSLPVEVRAEFDRLLREGRRMWAIKMVRESPEVEPKPSIHWLMDAIAYRSNTLVLNGR